jgi:hypothetical protein
MGLVDDEDHFHTEDIEMGHIVESYFHNLFTTTNPANVGAILATVER